MSESHQREMALIVRKVENQVVQQRATDGYINATAMCKTVPGKRFQNYRQLVSTEEFLAGRGRSGLPARRLYERREASERGLVVQEAA